ncbi:MAG: DUF262 domain-containing protein [Coriobacteriales bacterium]|nr:DUF262 domain-containing protein [Coriobacteriales bacterium]
MDANSRNILGLMSEMNVRFVVPVYQRPYSWGESQCAQLWDDILSCGRKRHGSHFTGSIVTIQDGHLSAQGVAPLLLIDGQQRITTITLLLIALARHLEHNPQKRLSFTRDEVLQGGFLTNHFRTGDDFYKLTLSKGDRDAYRRLIDSLVQGAEPELDPLTRLSQNLLFFERRVDALDNVDLVWAGLQRLEVVSISLAQGKDDPQVIFESMNATGKDLTNADLVRNFVLMSYPLAEQQDLYRTYWQPIEKILATDTVAFDDAFDDFIRSYLSVVHAPTSMAKVDVYQAFKRYVLFHGFNENDRMKNLSLKLKRFARYYAAVTRGQVDDEELEQALVRIAQLETPVVNPLLISLFDGFEHHEFDRESFVAILQTLESYLFRRAVCDCAQSELAPFFSSLIARLDAVRSEEGNMVEAFLSMLLNEEGTARRFPTDAEFAHALATRDIHSLSSVLYLLARIDESMEPTDTFVLEKYNWTLEHIMPRQALRDDAWRAALGADPERAFEECIESLGNLTLTPHPYDAQEGSFEEKLARVAESPLALATDILAASTWTPELVRKRTDRLAAQALEVWKRPILPEGAGAAFRLSERAATRHKVTFAELFEAGLVQMDDALVSVSPLHPGRATVTSTGKIMLANGQMFEDPTAAYERFLTSVGATNTRLDGWMYWRRGDGGPLLDDLRAELA